MSFLSGAPSSSMTIYKLGVVLSSAVYSLTETVNSDQIPHQGQGLSPQANVFAPEDHYFLNSKPTQGYELLSIFI